MGHTRLAATQVYLTMTPELLHEASLPFERYARAAMTKANLLGPWVRRFLLEYLVSERNLARNTQRSYRDTLSLLLPFVAQQVQKEVDQISVIDVSADVVRLFLRHL